MLLPGLSHPFLGLGPWALGIGENSGILLNSLILLSIYLYPLTCLSVYISLYIYIQCFWKTTFDFMYYSTQICHFSPLFFNFFSRSQIGKALGLVWEKRYCFASGMGPNIGPKLGRSRALPANLKGRGIKSVKLLTCMHQIKIEPKLTPYMCEYSKLQFACINHHGC